jgi:hypothetical protein
MQLVAKTRQLSQEPDEKLLSELRVLERKMGLVLTLVRLWFTMFVRRVLITIVCSSRLLYGPLSTNNPLQTSHYLLKIQRT